MVSGLFLFSALAGVVAEDESTLLQSVRMTGNKACQCGDPCYSQNVDREGRCLNNGRCDQRPGLKPVCGQDCNDSENVMDLACKVGLVPQDYCGSQHEADFVKNNFTAEQLKQCACVGEEKCRVKGCEDVNGPPHLCSSTCPCTTQNLLQSGINATTAARGAQKQLSRGAQNVGYFWQLFQATDYDLETPRVKVGLVNYMIDDDMPDSKRSDLAFAMEYWEQKTCIKFALCWGGQCLPAYDLPYILFRNPAPSDDCNSPMGVSWGSGEGDPLDRVNIINVGPGCKRGNIIHEIGHSLGLAHEHVRSDRDEFVKILWQNLQRSRGANFAKTDATRGRDLYKYDYASIMHYSKDSFGKGNPKKTTTETNEAIGQRNSLSDTDVASVNFMYNNCDWETWPGNAPTCVNSRQLPTQGNSDEVQAVAQEGQEFVVDFSANFNSDLTSTVEISPRRSIEKMSNGGQVAVSTVSFTPSSGDVGESYLIKATFTGQHHGQQCQSKVRVTVGCGNKRGASECSGYVQDGDCTSSDWKKWMEDNCCQACVDASAR